jgi:signal transduction histidine kinase
MNALTLLARCAPDSPDGRALLAILAEEAQRLAQVVDQLLDFGRPLNPRAVTVALEELVERAARVCTTRGEAAGRVLSLPTTAGTAAWLDPVLAELALVNVLRNALQATSASGAVRVSVEADDATARCIVVDDGPGIAAQVRGRIGQPFVTTRATGTGMGIAVVRRIMEASGGRLVVEPVEPRGTKVTLEFPRTDGGAVSATR